MPPIRTVLSRFFGIFRRRSLDGRLDEEVQFHLEMEAQKQVRQGMTPEDAALAARRAFGGEQLHKEKYRDQRGLPMLELLFKDIQYGFRMIARNPGFTFVAVLSLALGIGANTAIFTLIDAVLLRSLPVARPDELVAMGNTARTGGLSTGGVRLDVMSYPFYLRLRERNQVFSGLLATGRGGVLDASIDGGGVERVRGRMVSDNYFEVLGLEPSRGRMFASGDDRKPGANPIAVISYDYWVNRFARDPSIVGHKMKINGLDYTVIGVGPAGYTGEVVGSVTAVWLPLSMQAQLNPGDGRLDNRGANWLLLLGRLKPGVSFEQARTEMRALATQTVLEFEGGATLSAERVREIRGQVLNVERGGTGFSYLRSRFRRPLLILMSVVGLVLLIACANVANLLLARATTRQKEISVRLAVGASRFRLIRQLLTESILLASLGGIAGMLMAWAGSGILLGLASDSPSPIPLVVKPDVVMLAFTLGVSLLTGILFGLAPAIRSTRVELAAALKDSARSLAGGGRWQLGKVLVAGQVALSLLLLMGAGLFIRSLIHLQTLDVGYQRSNLLELDILPGAAGYAPEKQLTMTRQLMERLGALPGVAAVAVSVNGIFAGSDGTSDSLKIEGFNATSKQDTTANFDSIGPQYFHVVGVPMISGREFDEHDTVGSPNVMILNETMARFYFGNNDPVGKPILSGKKSYTIVGVSKDMKQQDLKGKTERRFYVPFFQSKGFVDEFSLEVRTSGDATALIPALRQEVHAFDSNLQILNLEPVRALIDESITDERLIAQLSGFFGALALVLAATGLYGIMAYTISRRANEIGLRMALGASQGELVRMVLRETLMLVGAGIVVGVPAALGLSRFVESALEGLSGSDPVTMIGAIAVLLAAALAAAWIPARRAARIDPLVALRQE
ncbi:MAG TPA: ABC transporter permease [Bryobacteraceae bacterium]|jgi:predicted permease